MDQWCILVLDTLRLGLNADYDRIQELANQHRTLREMLGDGMFTTEKDYGSMKNQETYLKRVDQSIELLKHIYKVPEILLSDLSLFTQHADRQIDQIKRRVIDDEKC